MLEKLIKRSLKNILKLSIHLRLHRPLVYYLAKRVVKIEPESGTTPRDKANILALKEQYFRGDLEILANTRNFNVYKLPYPLQAMLLRIYWSDIFREDADIENLKDNYFNPGSEKISKLQEKLRKALSIVLRDLYRKLDIDCVISANFAYIHNYDFQKATEELGIPFVVLHRENLLACAGMEKLWYDKSRNVGKFTGDLITVHNHRMKEIFIETGFAEAEKVRTCGCLRMDDFIKRIKANDFSETERNRRVTLFSFHHTTGLFALKNVSGYFKPGVGLSAFFEHVHVAFAEAAISNPKIDFVIKPKYGGKWYDAVNRVLAENNLSIEEIPNLSMSAERDVHDLIFNSSLVCSYGSTTILESAIAHRPVIIPFFDEAVREEYRDYVLFRENFDLFDIAESQEEFKMMIKKRLEDPSVSEEYLSATKELFENFVSSFNSNSSDKYTSAINEAINLNEARKSVTLATKTATK